MQLLNTYASKSPPTFRESKYVIKFKRKANDMFSQIENAGETPGRFKMPQDYSVGKKVSGCPGSSVDGEQVEEMTKGYKETSGGHEYVHYLNFMGVHMSKLMKLCTLNTSTFVYFVPISKY